MKSLLCCSLVFVSSVLVASASARRGEPVFSNQPPIPTSPHLWENGPTPASAALTTTELYAQKFDVAGNCNSGGWTKVDWTAQKGTFWHVEDFAGANVDPNDSLKVLAGTKSLWCGARAASTGTMCGYLALPGSGNMWDQSFQTKTCVPTDGTLDVSFMMEIDSDAGYDATYLEYTADCTDPKYNEWTTLDGGIGVWDNLHDAFTHTASYSGIPAGVKVRLRFTSDTGWSDEDASWDSHAGPVVVDNLQVEGLALEDFEGEALDATTTNNWESVVRPGYGMHIALYSGLTLLQEDECDKDLSCQWAAIENSVETYACGGFPLQRAVPKGNGEPGPLGYLCNEIWSPPISLIGTGAVVDLQFTVYGDMPLDNLVFYTWGARPINSAGCELAWRDLGFWYYADTQSYFQIAFPVGGYVAGYNSMRVKMGVLDGCWFWCGVSGSGSCHSHAPLLDNVRIYRVDIFGPTFTVRDMDTFQDTFPSDGTDFGTGSADQAYGVVPYDSVIIECLDPVTRVADGDPTRGNDCSGLEVDPALGGYQIYMWVRVVDSGVPAGPAKEGVNLQESPQYPYKDMQVADGKTWTRIRMDRANNFFSRWRIDLPDALFEAGDVIYYFFGATSTSGMTSYCSGNSLKFVQQEVDVAASYAPEFSILPLEPGSAGTDILYVDAMDDRAGQQYWDASFASLGMTPDRYDVRGPSSLLPNNLASRVTDVNTQLGGNYRMIVFDCGNLTDIVRDDDYQLINTFLADLTSPGGVYIGGDDIAENLELATGGFAALFKSVYISYALTSGSTKYMGYGTAPVVTGMPAGGGGQGAMAGASWLAYGGCPGINDFDVMEPTGSSVLQSTYGAFDTDNGADISQNTGHARVLLSGYAFQYVKDDEPTGAMDRDDYLRGILVYLGGIPDQPTDVEPVAVNELEQNYPNPFNPHTTIAFSIKHRARVKIDVYNVAGQRVKTLLDETRAAGSYTDVRWDGTDGANQPVSSGVYFYQLVTSNFSQTKKMVLLK